MNEFASTQKKAPTIYVYNWTSVWNQQQNIEDVLVEYLLKLKNITTTHKKHILFDFEVKLELFLKLPCVLCAYNEKNFFL